MNQYTYHVPFTEEELHQDYIQLQMSQIEIAKKYGTTQRVVWRAMRKMGIKPRKARKRNQFGKLNSSWRGGRVLMAKKREGPLRSSNGYFYILMPDHPNADKKGYVAEHVLVATSTRGKPLIKGEMVHHINLDKHDNSKENLEICLSGQHGEYHQQLAMIAISLLEKGLITFKTGVGYEPTSDFRFTLCGNRGI